MDDAFEALKREATAFIVRITSGTATDADADDLSRWRALSKDHERAFREAARIWKNLAPALGEKKPSTLVSRRHFLAGASLAAGVAGLVAGTSQLGYLPGMSAWLSDHATGVGEQRTVSLPDGSVADLDGDTALDISYTARSRQTRLVSGAAVFHVEAQDERPFEILAGEGLIGTREAIVAISHGVNGVSVQCLGGQTRIECRETVNLGAGEEIGFSARGLGEKRMVDMQTAAAWRRGLLVFNDKTLDDVVADINRHRRGKVIIARASLRSRHVSGVFNLARPQEMLAHLSETLQLSPVSLGGGVVLLL